MTFETLERREVLSADIYISEFLASNTGGLKDGDGDSSDWIELFNAGAPAVDLSGYYLTDSSTNLTKWAFPEGTSISPGGTLVVFASDKGAEGPSGELHTDYKLSAGGEYLGLIEPDGLTVVHEFAPEYPPQETNISYGLSMDASELTLVDESSSMRFRVPSNGGADNTWNAQGYNDNGWTLRTSGIGYETSSGSGDNYTSLINATVPVGTTSAYTRYTFNVDDPQLLNALSLEMLYDDGFVAYLNGVLIQSENAPASPAWNSTAGPINRPDETVLEAYVPYDVSEHVGLLVAGENVLAIHALNQAESSDMLMVARLVASSNAPSLPLVAGYFPEPTPGVPNGAHVLGLVADTKFSVDRGFYDVPFNVEITSETPGALIVYTTDGSAPEVDENLAVVNGTPYSGAIPIASTTNLRAAAYKLGFASTNIDTHTYFFTSDIVTQTHASTVNAGFPTSWGSRPADYGLDPDVIGPNDDFGGYYAALIEDSLTAIPSISLTLDSDDFFGANGIYANPQGSGISWERVTSAEMINPDGSEGFQIDAGLRVHGGASRVLTKKHALRLLFKSEYGASKLEYPLFGESGVDKFDTIVLRPHFNDGWGWDGALGDPLYIRDQWFRDTQAAMGHGSSRGSLVHLYVNGLYWGLYNPSERPDDSFAAELYGGEKSEYDVINHDGLHKGSIDTYDAMIGITQQVASSATELLRTESYFALQGKLADGSIDPNGEVWLDVKNYIDYMILNHYGGNNDWPDRNWYANRRSGDESEGFRFFAWDSEIALSLSNRTSLFENNIGQSTGAAEAFGNLVDSEEFRLAFADRIHAHLFNGGALYVNPDNKSYDPQNPQGNVPASRFAELAAKVYDPIVAESARWGDQHVPADPRTRNIDWQNSLDYMLATYFRDRHGIVLAQWMNSGLYSQTAAPEFLVDQVRQHGGDISAESEVEIENLNNGAQGTVYYTIDGSDPRQVGGSINNASATEYTGAVTLPAGITQVKARVLLGGVWSALTVASFDLSVPLLDNADFNTDGIVDSVDYAIWRENLGSTGEAGLPGDANHDGVVGSDDYQIWRSQYGSSPATSQLAAVPSSPSESLQETPSQEPETVGDSASSNFPNALPSSEIPPQSAASVSPDAAVAGKKVAPAKDSPAGFTPPQSGASLIEKTPRARRASLPHQSNFEQQADAVTQVFANTLNAKRYQHARSIESFWLAVSHRHDSGEPSIRGANTIEIDAAFSELFADAI